MTALTFKIHDRFLSTQRLNPLNTEPSNDRVPIAKMNSTTPDDPTSKVKADVQYFVGFDFRKIDNPHFHFASLYPLSSMNKNRLYTPQLNNISMEIPPSPPLYQMKDLPQVLFFCNWKMFTVDYLLMTNSHLKALYHRRECKYSV